MERLQHRWAEAAIRGSTHVPFELPYVGISGNDDAFARKATGILAQIILAGRVLNDESNRFIESRCWERRTDVDIPYGPPDFIRVTLFYNLVFGHALQLVKKQGTRRLGLKPWLLPPRSTSETTGNTMQSLIVVADHVLKAIRNKLTALKTAFNMDAGQVEEINEVSIPALHKVPVVSPREIRLWSMLNTVDFHEKVQQQLAQGSENFKKFWSRASDIVDEGRQAPNTRFPLMPGFEGRQDTDNAKEVASFNPSVFFSCSGITDKGARAHNAIHIGATQEQLASWPGLWFLRRDTRRISLDEDPQSWFDYYQVLSSIERRFQSEDALLKFREQVMKWRFGLSPNLPDGVSTQDCARLPLLRSCGHHIGQAFAEGSDNLYGIGCCFVCKLTMKYSEAKKLDLPKTAKKFDMGDRIKLPWSCAEVAASTWCEDVWYSNTPTEPGEGA